MEYIFSYIFLNKSFPDIIWNWDEIDVENIHFPKSFIWGTATAAHQVEGNNTNNNWFQWENNLDSNNNYRIHNNQISGLAADYWNKYPEDIQLMKEIGMNHYRFSIEWSKIEPRQGFFDESVIQHYRNVCDFFIKWNQTCNYAPSLHKSNMV